MKLIRPYDQRAFTIMELLVVIAIMVLVAGLVVGLSGVASEKRKMSRAQAELNKLVTLIEMYHAKVGMYPPDNQQTPFTSERNSLLYELAGAERQVIDTNRTLYVTSFGSITNIELISAFGINGLVNASDDRTEIKRILKRLKSDEYTTVGGNARVFSFPAEGPNGSPALWNYAVGTNAVHNPESFDLWVELVIGNKTNVVGNWKN